MSQKLNELWQKQLDNAILILEALNEAALNGAENVDLVRLSQDTGQTKIAQEFRDPNAISQAINRYEQQIIRLEQRLNGRCTTLIPEQNVNYGYYSTKKW